MVLLPFGERVLLDSPALSSLPGHVPTHEDRAFSDSKAAASGPTSAIIWTAESPRSRALPPLVAPRPDAPGVASRPPHPIAPSALPSTATPPAPSSASDGKLH